MARRLLDLEQATEQLGASRRRYIGVRPIPVAGIIGTEGRGDDFDAGFSPLKPHLRERVRRLGRAFPNGSFGPIRVEKLGDAYFVVDGHHRVAIARQSGMVTIDAEVTELKARWHLSAFATTEELRHAEQERLFMAASGLAEVRPDARIRFTRPAGYRELLDTVQVHGYGLMIESQQRLSRAEVAYDWYSNVYLPTVVLVAGKKLDGECRHATESDRFLWLWRRRHELDAENGGGEPPTVVRMATSEARRADRRHARRFRLSRSSARRARVDGLCELAQGVS
jgi:hypothetical protein